MWKYIDIFDIKIIELNYGRWNMIKTKKQMFIVIASFVLIIILGTATYAFFNYTRTGSSNTFKTGRIAFNTSQNRTINLRLSIAQRKFLYHFLPADKNNDQVSHHIFWKSAV